MIKVGVDLEGLQPEISLAYTIACFVFLRHNCVATITSGLEGEHREGSEHYKGQAIDLRIRDMDHRLWPIIAEELSKALGSQYDVILEAKKLHIHVEFDPK